MKTNVKIYLRNNKYIVKFISSKLNGEMVCKNAAELDDTLSKITGAFLDIIFCIRFSQGALGKYLRDVGNDELLYIMGYKFLGYISYNIRMFYDDKFKELIIIEEDGILTRCDLKNL